MLGRVGSRRPWRSGFARRRFATSPKSAVLPICRTSYRFELSRTSKRKNLAQGWRCTRGVECWRIVGFGRIDSTRLVGVLTPSGLAACAARSKRLAAFVEPVEALTSAVHKNKKRPTERRAFICLAHSGGFEPPTARFVAEYSIQLSYECVRSRTIRKRGVGSQAFGVLDQGHL